MEGVLEDPTGDSGEVSVEVETGVIQIGLSGHVLVAEVLLLAVFGHTTAQGGLTMDSCHIEGGRLGKDGVFVGVFGKPGDRDQAIESDLARSGGLLDDREGIDAPGGRHHRFCGVGGHVEASGHPLDQRSAPVCQRGLPAVDGAQRRHLSGSDAGNR